MMVNPLVPSKLAYLSLGTGYYDHFPPKSLNVEIKSSENGRKVLMVTKDIAAGETIYKVRAFSFSLTHTHITPAIFDTFFTNRNSLS